MVMKMVDPILEKRMKHIHANDKQVEGQSKVVASLSPLAPLQ